MQPRNGLQRLVIQKMQVGVINATNAEGTITEVERISNFVWNLLHAQQCRFAVMMGMKMCNQNTA